MNCTVQEEMYCPICGTVHKVTFLEKSAKAVIKNVEVSYIEKVFVCDLCDEDNEFVTPKLMNENLLSAIVSENYTENTKLWANPSAKRILSSCCWASPYIPTM